MFKFINMSRVRSMLSSARLPHKFSYDLLRGQGWVLASDGLPMPGLLDLQLLGEAIGYPPSLYQLYDTFNKFAAKQALPDGLTEAPLWLQRAAQLMASSKMKSMAGDAVSMQRVKDATARRLAAITQAATGDRETLGGRVFVTRQGMLGSWELWVQPGHPIIQPAPVKVQRDLQQGLFPLLSLLDCPDTGRSLVSGDEAMARVWAGVERLLVEQAGDLQILLMPGQQPRYKCISASHAGRGQLPYLHPDPDFTVTAEQVGL